MARVGEQSVLLCLFSNKISWFEYPLPEDRKMLITIAAWRLIEETHCCEDPAAREGAEHYLELFSGWECKCSCSTETGGICLLINGRTCRKQNDICVFSVLLLHIQQLTVLQKVKRMFRKSHCKFYLLIYGWNMNK